MYRTPFLVFTTPRLFSLVLSYVPYISFKNYYPIYKWYLSAFKISILKVSQWRTQPIGLQVRASKVFFTQRNRKGWYEQKEAKTQKLNKLKIVFSYDVLYWYTQLSSVKAIIKSSSFRRSILSYDSYFVNNSWGNMPTESHYGCRDFGALVRPPGPTNTLTSGYATSSACSKRPSKLILPLQNGIWFSGYSKWRGRRSWWKLWDGVDWSHKNIIHWRTVGERRWTW